MLYKSRSEANISFMSFLSSVGMYFAFVLVCGCIGRVNERIDQAGLKIPLFKVNDAEIVHVMQYLAWCAVPFGDNVYFNAIEKDGFILYEIGESNQVHSIANPQTTGKTISLICTNMSVRSVAQLVATRSGMEYGYTNGVIQLQLKTGTPSKARQN